jgi:two-component system, NtrC family, sensor kinase
MKWKILFFIFAFSASLGRGQNARIDSLKQSLAFAKDDLTRLNCLDRLFFEYIWNYPDSAAPYSQEALRLASLIGTSHALAKAYELRVWLNIIKGNYPEAFRVALEEKKTAELSSDFHDLVSADGDLSIVYSDEGDYENAISYTLQAESLLDLHGEANTDPSTLNGIVGVYEKFNHLDSALKYAILLRDSYVKQVGKLDWAPIPYFFGNIYSKMGNHAEAVKSYHAGIRMATDKINSKDLMDNCLGLAKTYQKMGQIDSSLYYAYRVLQLSQSAYYNIVKTDALALLADIYKSKNNSDSLAKYLELSIATKDSLFNNQKLVQINYLTDNEIKRESELAEQARLFRNKIILYLTLAVLLVILLIALILWRNNKHKEKAYSLLQKQKQEIDTQKGRVEKAFEELRVTQGQLIQSEKMASLGELTAGIAHEIQNPLNFVNNFSEVNKELIHEALQSIKTGDLNGAAVLLSTLEDNEDKIMHHGRRADAIVKGMLQHSRASTGQKELANINAIADECLRLSYHALRAKDKSFKATLKTDFDESIGNIPLIQQDIVRVFVNLLNNAFYATFEKAKDGIQGYEATVSIMTKKVNTKVEVRIKDNGNGIPQKVFDKIFQPFFTTKPAGQGTGLGLSMSYDIIKAHGGEIRVETKAGEYAEFIIQLPA